jgi:hypothetical protein
LSLFLSALKTGPLARVWFTRTRPPTSKEARCDARLHLLIVAKGADSLKVYSGEAGRQLYILKELREENADQFRSSGRDGKAIARSKVEGGQLSEVN